MHRFSLLLVLVLAVNSQAQTPLTLPFYPDLAAREAFSEWEGGVVLRIVPDADSVTTSGAIGDAHDLRIDVKAAWDEGGIFFSMLWQDDVWDAHWIPVDSARWDSPLNRPLDRMYFYDNLVIRLIGEERFYGVWMAPREDRPYQWDVVRYKDGTEDIAEEIKASQIRARFLSDEQLQVDVWIPWDAIHWQPEAGLRFQMRIIIPDSDKPEAPLAMEKIRDRGYLAQFFDVVLQGRE